jgi:Mrp family chromosome partitioning ATPase
MSKNFELLQQADKLHEISPQEERTPIAPPPAPVNPVAAVAEAPLLEVAENARGEISKLVHRLFQLPGTEAPQLVVFTGTEAGNGCSWLCARVGELLAAQVSGSVCLLDCNFRSPSLERQFGLENHYGLSDALNQSEGIRRFLRPLSRPNFWLLSCGSPVENGQLLLGSDRMRIRLQELRSEFEYIIVDTASLDAGTDGIVLGGLSDGVVLVLKANSSRRDTASKAMHEFRTANVPIRGVVLNRRTFPIPEAIYKHL